MSASSNGARPAGGSESPAELVHADTPPPGEVVARVWRVQQSGSDADQTASDSDQTASDGDQTASEDDLDASLADQASADRDQLASDRESAGWASQQLRDEATAVRAHGTRIRARQAAIRASATTARRLDADGRDRSATERDRTAEQRDSAATALDAASQPGGEREAKPHRDGDRERAANDRARAAEDRRRAAADRRRAAADRAEAMRERTTAESEMAQAALERERSETDELTRVLRRGVGFERLQREMDRARRGVAGLVVAFIDVDGLKRVNDACGHAAGDALLVAVADSLRAFLRSYDLIIRFGGDEFVCALPGVDLDTARERFLDVSAALAASPTQGSITVGFAELAKNDSAAGLIARADTDLLARRQKV